MKWSSPLPPSTWTDKEIFFFLVWWRRRVETTTFGWMSSVHFSFQGNLVLEAFCFAIGSSLVNSYENSWGGFGIPIDYGRLRSYLGRTYVVPPLSCRLLPITPNWNFDLVESPMIQIEDFICHLLSLQIFIESPLIHNKRCWSGNLGAFSFKSLFFPYRNWCILNLFSL